MNLFFFLVVIIPDLVPGDDRNRKIGKKIK
jgi:hypothetical protein